ncbi:hypothetical protein [Nocardioides sambongensis]|uniref:hypothetical protein n=1 Tax=Nocardioides sambongensis TaxID=2589074 RepID=UPI0015E83274|nr:hypothetical protein [Nocardioides sambongensis]
MTWEPAGDQHGRSGDGRSGDGRSDDGGPADPFVGVVPTTIADFVVRTMLEEMDRPHVVICHDLVSGGQSVSGPYADGLAALRAVEHERRLDLAVAGPDHRYVVRPLLDPVTEGELPALPELPSVPEDARGLPGRHRASTDRSGGADRSGENGTSGGADGSSGSGGSEGDRPDPD